MKKDKDSKILFYCNSCYAMGTRLNVVIAEPLLNGDFIFDQIVKEVARLETKLSRFCTDSDIYLINKNAGNRPVQIDAEIRDILLICRDYCERTNGAFDVTLPSRFRALETDQSIAQKYLSGYPYTVRVDSERMFVTFSNPYVQIDLGGFGKGYAIKKIELILRNNGIKNALVSFGESSILAIGHHPYGDCWKIGLENRQQPGQFKHVFELTDQSISTSGFQKRLDNSIGFHIINPMTQRPVELLSSITIQSADPLEAEILSTALFACLNTAITFPDNFNDCQVVRIDYNKERSMEICNNEKQ